VTRPYGHFADTPATGLCVPSTAGRS